MYLQRIMQTVPLPVTMRVFIQDIAQTYIGSAGSLKL